ncbi:MAG: PLP-dependent transferase [Candidatus Margulisiibacteriota bacterium]|nr:PLP-dependent transferase [Candidatus Margulisiibacteriota bacterium]
MAFDLATKCVYIENGIDEKYGAVNPPIYQSAGFSYPNPEDLEKIFKGQDFGYIYSRISNPTITDLERRINYLDSGFATVAVSSGLAAILTVAMVLAEKDANIVVSNSLFGGSRDLFEETIPKLGIDVRFCDVTDAANVAYSVDADTAFVFAEIISNPKLVVPNIGQLKAITTEHNIPLVIDATLTASVGFNAKEQGVDVTIYSSTKLFATNGGAVGGLIVDNGKYDWRQSKCEEVKVSSKKVHRFAFIERVRRHALNNAGFNTSPMNAYFTMLGLETLQLRYERICQNAQQVAEFFKYEGVNVNYPGLANHVQSDLVNSQLNGFGGPLLTIDLETKERAFSFISKLKIAQNMSNLGDNRTMVIHPKSTIYSKHNDDQLLDAGVTDGLVRINVGIESINDLKKEFKEALV